jgi:hypothetical protein
VECRHEPHRKDVYMLRQRVDWPSWWYYHIPISYEYPEPPQLYYSGLGRLSCTLTGLFWTRTKLFYNWLDCSRPRLVCSILGMDCSGFRLYYSLPGQDYHGPGLDCSTPGLYYSGPVLDCSLPGLVCFILGLDCSGPRLDCSGLFWTGLDYSTWDGRFWNRTGLFYLGWTSFYLDWAGSWTERWMSQVYWGWAPGCHTPSRGSPRAGTPGPASLVWSCNNSSSNSLLKGKFLSYSKLSSDIPTIGHAVNLIFL